MTADLCWGGDRAGNRQVEDNNDNILEIFPAWGVVAVVTTDVRDMIVTENIGSINKKMLGMEVKLFYLNC